MKLCSADKHHTPHDISSKKSLENLENLTSNSNIFKFSICKFPNSA